MLQTFTAVYDGQTLKPDTLVDLELNKRYVISVQESTADEGDEGSAWQVLESLAGTLDAPEDWSVEHNHYLYGTPKRGGGVLDGR